MLSYSLDFRPQIKVIFDNTDVKKPSEDEIIDVEEFIGVKGEKAKGKRITIKATKKINFIEPLPYEEEAPEREEEAPELIENNPEVKEEVVEPAKDKPKEKVPEVEKSSDSEPVIKDFKREETEEEKQAKQKKEDDDKKQMELF
jgi:topoisomerase-4 subunit A